MKAPDSRSTAVASPMHLPTQDSYANSPATNGPEDDPGNGILPATLALARTLETETDRALAIVGLTARGFLALREIRSGRATTQQDLARRLHLEPSTTCELLARLARRRLVARGPGRLGSGRATRRSSRRGCGERDGPRERGGPPTLTLAGATALERAEKVVARLEREWARRMRAARGSAGDGWLGPIYGLRRWIAEGLSSIAAPASPRPSGPPGTPRPVRPAGSRAAP